MLWAAFLLVLAAPSSGGVNLGQFRLNNTAQLLRYDYADRRRQLRVTEIVNIADVRKERVASVTLFSSGDLRFVRMLRKDVHTRQHVEILISDKGRRVEFQRTVNPDLSDEERARGVVGSGVLTIDGESMMITLEAAGPAVVPDSVAVAFSRWGFTEREGLRLLYRETISCPLRIGKGVVLPALIDSRGPSECQPGMVNASPDRNRDAGFLILVPELGDWLGKPATLRSSPAASSEKLSLIHI